MCCDLSWKKHFGWMCLPSLPPPTETKTVNTLMLSVLLEVPRCSGSVNVVTVKIVSVCQALQLLISNAGCSLQIDWKLIPLQALIDHLWWYGHPVSYHSHWLKQGWKWNQDCHTAVSVSHLLGSASRGTETQTKSCLDHHFFVGQIVSELQIFVCAWINK